MKSRIKTFIVISIILLAYGSFSLFSRASQTGLNQPDYTVFSATKNGVSVLYDTLNLMNYPVHISMQRITPETSIHDIHWIVQPDWENFTNEHLEDLMGWVFKGGRLIFLSSNLRPIQSYIDTPPYSVNQQLDAYPYGLGEVILGSPSPFVNATLKNRRANGAVLPNLLDSWGFDQIYFNEYYHGFQENPTLWRSLGSGFRLIIWQAALTVLAAFWLYGKRFGRPIPYYEEIEREENEYVLALAAIYKNAGKGRTPLLSYYNQFLYECSQSFNRPISTIQNNLLQLWKEAQLDEYQSLLEIESDIQDMEKSETPLNTKKKKDQKKLIQTIQKIKKCQQQLSRLKLK